MTGQMVRKKEEVTHARDLQLGSSSRLRSFVVLALTIVCIYVCFLLLLPFLPALVWALALAVLCVPAHRLLEQRLGNRNLAATTSVVLIGLVVVVPALLLSSRVIDAAAGGAALLKERFTSGEWRRVFDDEAWLAPLARWIAEIDLKGAGETVSGWLTTTSASFVTGSVLGIITLLATFYLLFYFLRDREAALAWLREISPLSDADMDNLYGRVADTIEATLYGTVVVAAVQGILGGLMFWLLGLPMPVFWGLVMGLLAIVPMLGAFVIWVPAAIYLAVSADWGNAIILTVWGIVVVGLIDNLLYPILVKNQLRLHTVPAFISIVGGLILFGASGILLGPLIVTVTMFLMELWSVPVAGPDSEN